MRLKKIINSCGLNFKVELAVMIFTNAAFIALLIYFIFFLSNFVYVGVVVIFIVLFNVLNIFRFYLNKKHNDDKEINDLLSSFKKLYVELNQNNDVVSSLIASKESSSLKISNLIDELINEIKSNNNVEYYLKFAHNFKTIQVEELLIRLHFLSVNNSSKYLNEFNDLYNKLLNDYEVDYKKKVSISFSLIKSTPIFALIVVIFITIIAIALIIGKDFNV